jgi:carbonic anhydrase/acetyltransferase-like protein (isoleucine patch superfamily)
MNSEIPRSGIRPNPVGDWPKVDPTAFVDPSAQIMGHVIIGPGVYVGPLSVIRADEVDEHGTVHPVIIEKGTCVQDGVIIHGRAGSDVRIGPDANISHGVIVHGPATIKSDCFVAIRAVVYNSVLEESVWVGVGSIIMGSTVPANTWVPVGSIIRTDHDTRSFRLTDLKEQRYKKNVFDASAELRQSYLKMYGGAGNASTG